MDIKPIDLAYEEHGSGTPLILIHGFPLSRKVWYPLVAHLEKSARVILLDLRGHGESPVVEGVSTMRIMAEDIERLMNRLEIEKAIVAGMSMGGYVAMSFAQAYPNRLAGLGLLVTQSTPDSPEKRHDRLKQAEYVARKGTATLIEGMIPRLSARTELYPTLREIMAVNSPKGLVAAMKGMADRPDATEWLASINVPTMVLAGKQDGIIPFEKAQLMAQFLPWSWLVELPSAGHMPMMEDPESTAKELLNLLKTVK